MHISLSLYATNDRAAVGEGRVVLDALRHYAEEIERNGFAQREGDAPATLSVLVSVSLQMIESLLDQTENLDEVAVPTGSIVDGCPDYLTAYYPTTASPADAVANVLNQRAVLHAVLDRAQTKPKMETRPTPENQKGGPEQ